LFQWYELAFQENPFLSESNSFYDDSIASSGGSTTYWTTKPTKAKEFIDQLFKQDAETLKNMARRVSKNVAAGKASTWLSRTNKPAPDSENK
jgi:hypothetical protein